MELLGLAFNHPTSHTGWMEKWPLLTRLRADLEAELGAEVYSAAWERGAALDLETTARALLAHWGVSGDELALLSIPAQALPDPLTERELEILHLIAEGMSNREIADRLVLAVGTVKWYLDQVYSKLSVHSRIQAIARARELDLLS